MRKKKHEEHENAERWLISYADFITLLFAFFVVMYATSSVNQGKLRAVADAINSAFNPFVTLSSTNIRLTEARIGTEMFDIDIKRYIKIQETVEVMDAGKKTITVSRDRRGLIIRVADTLVFETGRAEILPQHGPMLDKIAELLAEIPNQVHVEGHTDNVPIRTPQFPSNWELSANRAATIVRYFVEQRSLDPRRFSVGGNGEFRPIASNNTPEGQAKNRRVDIVVLQTPKPLPAEGASENSGEESHDPSAVPSPGPGATVDDPLVHVVSP
ncbi:MAG: OmpA family protein [Nitrospirae bacterium]|nr:OmpA family protein [Nitrospirota bacterium]